MKDTFGKGLALIISLMAVAIVLIILFAGSTKNSPQYPLPQTTTGGTTTGDMTDGGGTTGTGGLTSPARFIAQKGVPYPLSGTNHTFVITNMINSPCPPNANCIWSGMSLSYELRDSTTGAVLGSGTATGPFTFPYVAPGLLANSYHLIIFATDYATYADVQIN